MMRRIYKNLARTFPAGNHKLIYRLAQQTTPYYVHSIHPLPGSLRPYGLGREKFSPDFHPNLLQIYTGRSETRKSIFKTGGALPHPPQKLLKKFHQNFNIKLCMAKSKR
jgi:hypothetical protein